MQSMPASISQGSTVSPKQCAVTRAPCSWAVAIAVGERLGRERRRQVAVVAGDPVADQLHPAVARLRLLGDVRRRGRRARPRGRSCGCSAGCARGGVRTGSAAAGRRGPAPSGCRPASRSRAAAARRRRGRRPPARSVVASSTAPCSSSPMWQWASTRPGHDPALGRGLGPGLRLEGDPAVDDVEVAGLAVGQHGAAEAQCRSCRTLPATDVVRPGGGRSAVESPRRRQGRRLRSPV